MKIIEGLKNGTFKLAPKVDTPKQSPSLTLVKIRTMMADEQIKKADNFRKQFNIMKTKHKMLHKSVKQQVAAADTTFKRGDKREDDRLRIMHNIVLAAVQRKRGKKRKYTPNPLDLLR